MDKELLLLADDLYARRERLNAVSSKIRVYPVERAREVVDGMWELNDKIGELTPSTREELIQFELKRRLEGDAIWLDHHLQGKNFRFEDVIKCLGFIEEDIDGLRPWLETNRRPALDAVNRFFDGMGSNSRYLSPPLDQPNQLRTIEGLAYGTLANFHAKIGSFLANQTDTARFLVDVYPELTLEKRSYFNNLTSVLASSVHDVAYQDPDRTLRVDIRQLLRIYGHEGMGHGLQKVITEAKRGLPKFLQTPSYATEPTQESITQFYELRLFKDLADAPEVVRELGISDQFKEIYQEEHDRNLIGEFRTRSYMYAIRLMANRTRDELDDPQVRKDIVAEIDAIALEPWNGRDFMNSHIDDFDYEGNLRTGLVFELRYADRSIDRGLEMFANRGITYTDNRSLIDFVFLTGYWTSRGMKENMGLVAKQGELLFK